eukprot:CAMPEP_0119312262 /NCGR_PEP_ID=MMETSP1333-20130426/25688_1 /TAXON_ID=418940 /ORGANISM="Scyphosphaera apsteinii, Strain RCC1455" /LENGTH=239 /DNA_ID=CAMNT_0007316857 /DNA_START=42 /DNA_END=761 /DNA_ORIENTATION=+
MPSWLPLESNPEVLNPFVQRLGLPDGWGFTDVFGVDPDLLMMIPQPCVALCLLYPSEHISKPRREELRATLSAQPSPPDQLFFMQQHDGIGNACGTLACMHAVANAAHAGVFSLRDGSPLAMFIEQTKSLTVSERGWELAKAKDLQEMSDATAAAGTTEGAGTDDAQNSHFICFVNVSGFLYELDGRTFDSEGVAFPVCHGATTADAFVFDAVTVIRDHFIARDPSSINFNITALCRLE